LLGLVAFAALVSFKAQEMHRYLDLRGKWKFTISNHENWNRIDFFDNAWDEIQVPSAWENEGYHGYNGYGYYRRNFSIPATVQDNGLYLFLGYIDDVDEVYLNGVKIGSSGSFPPHYMTAYKSFRSYAVPKGLLRPGAKNTIAVKVYDSQLDGGILHGKVGIYGERNPMDIAVDMRGKWKFNLGDNMEYRNENFDDSGWDDMIVPSFWEDRGYHNYDGYAWYRKEVEIPAELKGKQIVLVLGKIDDVDETYLNGKKVGQIGNFDRRIPEKYSWNDHEELRAYFLEPSDFKAGETNTIAIRVYDFSLGGGIYKGPIAIVELDKFVSYWRQQQSGK
jgi:hypothetical protein